MADEENKTDGASKGKSPVKTIVTIMGILILEAVLIIGAMMYLSNPDKLMAEAVPDQDTEGEKIVEILVLDDRLPNSRQGINYLYDTEIWAHVKQKHNGGVSEELERYRNEIRSDLIAIWKTSEPRHFLEPKMENLTRKVHALMSQRFGNDLETSEPIVRKVVIVSGPAIRVDG